MKQFLVNYFSSPESMQKMATATPEEKAAGMKPWMDWKEAMGDHLVNMGAPLMPAQNLSGDKGNGRSTGFSIIQAESMEASQQLLADHPHLKWDDQAAIEISEFAPM